MIKVTEAEKLKETEKFDVDIKKLNDKLNQKSSSDTEEDNNEFVVDSDEKASWCLRKIRQIKEKQEKNEKLAQELISKLREEIKEIEKWRDEENDKLQNSIDFFESKLYNYALKLREDDPELKTYSLPFGKLKFRKQRPKWKYKDDKLLEFLEDNYPDLVRVKKKPDKRNLKKTAEVNGNKVVLPDTGEIIEGVKVVERSEKFKVDVEA